MEHNPHEPVNSADSKSFVRDDGAQSSLPRSCHDCNRRKVRCNKIFPCDNCVRLGVECTFPPPGRRSRRRKKTFSKAELISRLDLLEREVKKLSAESVGLDCADSHASQSSQESPESSRAIKERKTEIHEGLDSTKATPSKIERQFGRLVVDRSKGTSRYVNHQVLAELGNQIKEFRDLCDSHSSPAPSSEEDTASPGSIASYSETHNHFLFSYHSLARSLRRYYPSPTCSHVLLNIFEENVAPIITIIHKPTLRSLIQTACMNREELDRSSEALVFSVYFSAVSSMTPEQCLTQLGEDHITLLQHYRFAVEQALARADFLRTHKMVVLQAAVLFLSCVRQPKDAQFVWTMIAVVTRLGLGMGLHRDGSHFGLSPFETEMRRRLWWYICLLDSQSSDYQTTAPQIREEDYDTRLPLNINDDDLSSDLVEPPQEQIGFTEMTLCLIRCEILISHRKLMQMTSPRVDDPAVLFKNRELAIKEFKQSLDERYLQFCDLTNPIQWVATTIARVALGRLWLVSHFVLVTAEGFDANLWPDQCELLLVTAIEVLEFVYLLETHENTAKWSWLFEGYVQWHSFAYVLSKLCVLPASPLSDRAWIVVNRVYERWKVGMCQRGGIIMRLLTRLMNRAVAIRARQLPQSGSDHPLELNPAATYIPDPLTEDFPHRLNDFPRDLLAVDNASLDMFRDLLMNAGLVQM